MISIVYITNRKSPMFEWFASSLARQLDLTPIEVIVVDGWSEERAIYFDSHLPAKIDFRYVKPLPSFCQGKHRLTKDEWFSATIARNTGFVYAKYDYVVFADDLSVLMPEWLKAVKEAAMKKYVVEGCYEKRNKLVVENGLLVNSEALPNESGVDSRFKQVPNKDGLNQGYPEWLFGCSFGMPLKLALQMNGFDEMCSITGYEDTQFGMRLSKLRTQFRYDTRMKSVESAEMHFTDGQYFKRIDPETDRDTYYSILSKFGLPSSIYSEIQRYDASHIIVDTMKQLGHKAYWNNYDLNQLRAKAQNGEEITVEDMNFPKKWWFDDSQISDL